MKIVLERYYGDWRITKSVMTVFGEMEAPGKSGETGNSGESGISGESGEAQNGCESTLGDEGVLLRCEAREPRFAQYLEAFPGCSKYCLACGRWQCKPMATDWGPMTLTVLKSPGHRSCRIAWDYTAQVKHNTVLVGESDGYELAEYRNIVRSRETFEMLTELVYQAFGRDEEIWLEVRDRVEFLATLLSEGQGARGEGQENILQTNEHIAVATTIDCVN